MDNFGIFKIKLIEIAIQIDAHLKIFEASSNHKNVYIF